MNFLSKVAQYLDGFGFSSVILDAEAEAIREITDVKIAGDVIIIMRIEHWRYKR